MYSTLLHSLHSQTQFLKINFKYSWMRITLVYGNWRLYFPVYPQNHIRPSLIFCRVLWARLFRIDKSHCREQTVNGNLSRSKWLFSVKIRTNVCNSAWMNLNEFISSTEKNNTISQAGTLRHDKLRALAGVLSNNYTISSNNWLRC